LINSRLALIIDSIREMENLATFSYDSFVSDFRNAGAAGCFLLRSIAAMFDIRRHILAKTGGIDLSEEYKSIEKGLVNKNIVDHKLRESLIQLAEYRNRLVYLYDDISAEELYEIINKNIWVLISFVSGIRKYAKEMECVDNDKPYRRNIM
jgi:uncharacterized protein YutE (UPF0331/DUF86 family)